MPAFANLKIAALLAFALVGLAAEIGWAGQVFTVRIDDLTEGTPTVGLTGAPPVPTPTIVGDTAGEFLHFTLPAIQIPTGIIFYSDLFEDRLGGTLSDRLLVTYTANGTIVDVKFASDPATIVLPPGASNRTNLVEDGTFQSLGFFQAYDFQVRSDRADVPLPATLLLLGAGLVTLGRATRRRRPRA